jgi:hypothetical protein
MFVIDQILDIILVSIFLVGYLCFPLGLLIYVVLSVGLARLFLTTRLRHYIQLGKRQRNSAVLLVAVLVFMSGYLLSSRTGAAIAGIADTYAPQGPEVYELWFRYLVPAPIRPDCIIPDEMVCQGANRFGTPMLKDQFILVIFMLPFGVIGGVTALIYKSPYKLHPRGFGP